MRADWKVCAVLATVLLACPRAVVAQTIVPPSNTDLLVPPDLRAGARPDAPRPVVPRARGPREQRVTRTVGMSDRLPTRAGAAPAHPVDLGVVMRGGSATPKLVSPLGSTQAVRESGNAFGAGMRIGF